MLNKLIKNKLLGNAHAFIIKMCPGENTIYSIKKSEDIEFGGGQLIMRAYPSHLLFISLCFLENNRCVSNVYIFF